MRWLGLLLLLSACQDLFKLEHVDRPDAAIAPDVPPRPADAPPTACWNPMLTGNDDGDAYADGCDPCPGNPDMDPTDSDQDGIPDVCDPEVGSNTILAFYPLDRIDQWAASGGTWSIQGTDLAQSDRTASNALATFLTSPPSSTWVQVDLLPPDPATSVNTLAGLYLATGGGATPFDGLTCDLVRAPTSNSVTLQPTYYAAGNAEVNSSVLLGAVTEVWLSGRVSDGSCVAYANHTRSSASAPSGVNRSPQIVLHTSFSTGHFKSMTLFSSAL